MHIERIQVEEGFLDGLDLELVPGLNVIIGARGTGKTSLIELIRFCLGVAPFTETAQMRASSTAKSVLGSGQLVVTHEFDYLPIVGNGVEFVRASRTQCNDPRLERHTELLRQYPSDEGLDDPLEDSCVGHGCSAA